LGKDYGRPYYGYYGSVYSNVYDYSKALVADLEKKGVLGGVKK